MPDKSTEIKPFASDRPIRRIVNAYDPGLIRWYCRVRFTILRQRFLEEIGQYLPDQGRVLDMGCGFGLFSLYFATTHPGLRLHGIDLNDRRIRTARATAERLGIDRVEYEAMNALDFAEDDPFDAIYLLDLMHHVPREAVPELLAKLVRLLKPGGRLIVKDVEPVPWHKMAFTLALDRLMVGLREPIHYWPKHEAKAMLADLGLTVYSHAMVDVLPYPHILYVCEKG